MTNTARLLLLLTAALTCRCHAASLRPHISAEPATSAAAVNIFASALPSLPQTVLHLQSTILPVLKHFQVVPAPSAAITRILPDAPNGAFVLLNEIPAVSRVRRQAEQHLNTTDGSSVDAFSICYRLSSRFGFQIIPGDPAPVKLPVTSLANNTGVTVGMTFRPFR